MNNQTIIAFSSRKGGGKNTAGNFIIGLHLVALSITKKFSILDDGKLYIHDLWGDTAEAGILDVQRGTPEMNTFLAEHLDQYVKLYSFADLLKEVCIKILGLTYEQCYGTDNDKNSITALRWENMPGVITNKLLYDALMKEVWRVCNELDDWQKYEDTNFKLIYHEPGQMTAREVLQFVGTDIFRKMSGNVWVDALMRRIKEEGSATAIITDCRFPNEVEGVQKEDGKVIYLTRSPYNDTHYSETALDKENFDWNKFDYICNNKDMDIATQNLWTYDMLKVNGLLPIEIEEFEHKN